MGSQRGFVPRRPLLPTGLVYPLQCRWVIARTYRATLLTLETGGLRPITTCMSLLTELATCCRELDDIENEDRRTDQVGSCSAEEAI